MFEGFTSRYVPLGDATVFVRHGGRGPAVLLLHGHPRTSATWHRVAPLLVERGFTVVCADPRGYGRSRGPAPSPDHANHSKRAVAADMAAVMRLLGHDRFALVGHDRGGYVALRLTLDHPELVSRVALIDCLPVSEHLSRLTSSPSSTREIPTGPRGPVALRASRPQLVPDSPTWHPRGLRRLARFTPKG
ncbi:alpha/beta hydrolase [Nocardiopsis akebiae]|uniref:alpha/beta hydrolase n=1 Tax=Nocardiopsis akebiae TaxID=2831968 RepID=UPI0020161D1A|nr:alpha/beta fold hydrolase [Nocardiopsis akebiae]